MAFQSFILLVVYHFGDTCTGLYCTAGMYSSRISQTIAIVATTVEIYLKIPIFSRFVWLNQFYSKSIPSGEYYFRNQQKMLPYIFLHCIQTMQKIKVISVFNLLDQDFSEYLLHYIEG